MPEQALKELKATKNWLKYGLGALIFLICILFIIVFSDRNNESDRRQREKDQKIEARIESTRLYNVDQTRRREFQTDNILTLVKLGGKTDPEVVKASPEFAQYITFVNDSYPYRQTSADCVNALFDPEIGDCPSASNEAGDP